MAILFPVKREMAILFFVKRDLDPPFTNLLKDPEGTAAPFERAAERRKRRAEALEKEIKDKMKKIDEPGETIEDIVFFRGACDG